MDAPPPPVKAEAAEVRPAAAEPSGDSGAIGAKIGPSDGQAGATESLVTFPKGPPSHAYGPNDFRPATRREVELCRRADQFDWVYFAGIILLDVGAVTADTQFFRSREQPGVRLMGPSLAGLAWGMTISGTYLSLPKCDARWVEHASPEGQSRSRWPLAITLAGLASVTAPFFARIEQGPIKEEWAVWERTMTVILPMGTAIVGAALPYVLPPRTYAAARELEKIRLDLDRDAGGAGRFNVGYRFVF